MTFSSKPDKNIEFSQSNLIFFLKNLIFHSEPSEASIFLAMCLASRLLGSLNCADRGDVHRADREDVNREDVNCGSTTRRLCPERRARILFTKFLIRRTLGAHHNSTNIRTPLGRSAPLWLLFLLHVGGIMVRSYHGFCAPGTVYTKICALLSRNNSGSKVLPKLRGF